MNLSIVSGQLQKPLDIVRASTDFQGLSEKSVAPCYKLDARDEGGGILVDDAEAEST